MIFYPLAVRDGMLRQSRHETRFIQFVIWFVLNIEKHRVASKL
jgi:hypothetical protein